ncbi:efflux RND transporter permease subunit [Thermogemmatispora carboxidivorans]|uniref:efflux RND transporter permease subunit n=1 Tax=Thermogemmatispora carboxidivorans TaxID=1382306 RepID=UPI0009DE89E6|nr:efflux RND transporter permease subunit [Thermogemmatispora carboxidivorans]
MHRLAKLSMANRSIVALATIAVLLLGGYIIPLLKQELLPPLVYPAISVITAYPGAAPAQVEQDITDPLESDFQGNSGVQRITSQSSQGLSVITIYYNFGTDLDRAQQTISEEINKAQSSLPSNVTPQVQQYDFADVPIITLAVSSDQNQQDLAVRLKQIAVPALQGINGVATVSVTGVRQQIVSITLDPKKLQQYNLTVNQVEQVLEANNITLPAGQQTTNDQTLAVRVGNTLGSLDDLKNLVVGEQAVLPQGQLPSSSTAASASAAAALQQQQSNASTSASAAAAAGVTLKPIKLGDVATVKEDLAPSTTLTRTNGKPSLGISITKTNDGNAVSISQDVNSQIPDLERKLGYHANITVVSDQAPYIQESVRDLAREGLLGALFAVVVILIFLLSVRSTLVTAISIPLSIVIALICLWVGNYSLNLLTLSGLTIAVGRVVDDSIVVLENIYRHLRGGEDKRTAVLAGVKEVATAVTASTLTTVCVFLPLAFIGDIVGEYAHPLAFSVTVALLASLLVALTIIPVLAYWFLKRPAEKAKSERALPQEKPSFLERGYVPLVRWVTHHRAITLVVALLLFLGSCALFPLLPVNVFGNQGATSFRFSQKLEPTASLARLDAAARPVENMLSTIPDIQAYQVTIGGGGNSLLNLGPGASNGSGATYIVTVKSSADLNQVQQTVRDRLKGLQGVGTFTFLQNSNSNIVDITVQAPDETTLRQAAQQVYDAVADTPNTTDVSSDLSSAVPLIDVHVDPTKALAHGLTAVQVGQLLQTVYNGTTVTHVTLNGEQQDVDLKLGTAPANLQQLRDLRLPTGSGSVRLGDIATVSQVNGPTQISHLNGTRTATITLTATIDNVGAVTHDVEKRINSLHLPDGASASLGTNTSLQNQALQQFYFVLLVAIPLVYIVMVATFRSLVQPLILLISIPFAGVGSLILAAITRTPIGVSSLFGFLMLIGIVVTNAIVLIDLVNQYRARGLDARAAVVEGGRRRLRPILMTALATIMALIPMALGIGGGDSLLISGDLAIVVIGGLTSSTMLTLLLVPTLYVLVEDIKERFTSRPTPPTTGGERTEAVAAH